MKLTASKPRIRNVVSTGNLEQNVGIERFAGLEYGIYDPAIYRGRCGYVKIPGMEGRVTVFRNGKMISVGERSIPKSKKGLNNAKSYLAKQGLVENTSITPIVRNLLATADVGKKVPIDTLSVSIRGAIYDPETFPGMIIKGIGNSSCIVFASGKIVVAGTKSVEELNTALFELIQRLNTLL